MKFLFVFCTFFGVLNCFQVPDINLEDYFDEDGFELPIKLNVTEIFNELKETKTIETKVDKERIENDYPNFYDELESSTHETTTSKPKSSKNETDTPKPDDNFSKEKMMIETTLKPEVKVTKNETKMIETTPKPVVKFEKDDKMTITLKVDKESMTPTTIEVRVPTINGERKKSMTIPNGGETYF